jgi:hypothetical protein
MWVDFLVFWSTDSTSLYGDKVCEEVRLGPLNPKPLYHHFGMWPVLEDSIPYRFMNFDVRLGTSWYVEYNDGLSGSTPSRACNLTNSIFLYVYLKKHSQSPHVFCVVHVGFTLLFLVVLIVDFSPLFVDRLVFNILRGLIRRISFRGVTQSNPCTTFAPNCKSPTCIDFYRILNRILYKMENDKKYSKINCDSCQKEISRSNISKHRKICSKLSPQNSTRKKLISKRKSNKRHYELNKHKIKSKYISKKIKGMSFHFFYSFICKFAEFLLIHI